MSLYDGNIILNPTVINSGILNILKKVKIVKSINSVINYNSSDIPVATINMGKLREFDSVGVREHFERIRRKSFEKEVSSSE